MNQCIISISSNQETAKNISLAIDLLKKACPMLKLSSQLETSPFGSGYPANFQNVVAWFQCENDFESLNFQLKEIESELGRTAEMKIKKLVPIDLDIVIWNNEIVRDDYYKFPFLKELIGEITNA